MTGMRCRHEWNRGNFFVVEGPTHRSTSFRQIITALGAVPLGDSSRGNLLTVRRGDVVLSRGAIIRSGPGPFLFLVDHTGLNKDTMEM